MTRLQPRYFSIHPHPPVSRGLQGTPQPPSSSLPFCRLAIAMASPGVRIRILDSGLTRQVNDKPAVHLILLRDEGAGALGVFRGWGGAEEEAGEALEHRGAWGVDRPHGGALRQGKTWESERGVSRRRPKSTPLLAWDRGQGPSVSRSPQSREHSTGSTCVLSAFKLGLLSLLCDLEK